MEEKIRDYIIVNWEASESQYELKEFLTFLGPAIKREIIVKKYGSIIRKQDILEGMIEQVLFNLTLLTYKPDEYIIKQGYQATHIFFMCRGNCEILQLIDRL
jgi:hypothetical protein